HTAVRLLDPARPPPYVPASARNRFRNNKRLTMVAPVSDKSFQADVLQSKEPVLVDFWAEWCGPCRAVSPVLEEVAGELKGKLKVVKLNVDENPETTAKYGIQSIPTLMIFKNGELASRQIGAAPKAKIVQWITAAV